MEPEISTKAPIDLYSWRCTRTAVSTLHDRRCIEVTGERHIAGKD
jgi:hypothetical protein